MFGNFLQRDVSLPIQKSPPIVRIKELSMPTPRNRTCERMASLILNLGTRWVRSSWCPMTAFFLRIEPAVPTRWKFVLVPLPAWTLWRRGKCLSV